VFVNDMVARQLGRDRPLSPWSCETVEKLGGHVHILNKPEQLRGPLSPHRKDGTQNEEAGPYRQSVSARLSSSVMRPLGALDIQDSCFDLQEVQQMLVEPNRDVVVISDVPRAAQTDLVKESRQAGHPTQQDFGTARIALRAHGRHSLCRPRVA